MASGVGFLQDKATMKSTQRLLVLSFLLGWIFDFLFWDKEPGASFPLFVTACVLVGLYLARQESLRIPRFSLTLLLPIGFFAVMTMIRLEPFTLALNYLLTLGLLGLMAMSLTGGQWPLYTLSDYCRNYILLGVSSVIGPLILLSEGRDEPSPGEADPPPSRKAWLPVLGGVLLALPLVIFFASLLSAADPIFGEAVESLFSWLRIENLPEYIFRLILIMVIAYLLVGVLDHALHHSQDEKLLGGTAGWLPPFLGSIQASIVLASIDLLFATFVFFQFRYFFGGQVTLEAQGLTYSEYARRGFWELLAVGLLSFFLFWGLSTITRRETLTERRRFSFLSITLMVLVSVILVSALQRLLLYENAFGFTRLRTYAHIFMIWLGVLLVVLVFLEAFQRQQKFALTAFLAVLGFGITLNLLNVDRFIVHQNISRTLAGKSLDTNYLATLSPDAVPALAQNHARELGAPEKTGTLEEEIALTLTCHAQLNNDYTRHRSWQSFNFSRTTANRIWKNWEPDYAAEVSPEDCGGYWD
jgi:hypothetical protein